MEKNKGSHRATLREFGAFSRRGFLSIILSAVVSMGVLTSIITLDESNRYLIDKVLFSALIVTGLLIVLFTMLKKDDPRKRGKLYHTRYPVSFCRV